MKLMKPAALALLTVLLAAAGCGGGSGGGYSGGGSGDSPPPPPAAPAPPPPPPPTTTTNFTVFTRDLLVSANTSETGDPVDLESIEWAFTDDDNATAYDDIITATGP